VVDHSALAGAGLAAANSVHRMDRDLAIAALKAAGFTVEAESALYLRPTIRAPPTCSIRRFAGRPTSSFFGCASRADCDESSRIHG
jgi:hypothetical protein